MTLRDIMASDGSHLAGTTDLGEVLSYRPGGVAADAYDVQGVVDRLGIVTDDEGSYAFKAATIQLPAVGATHGPTARPASSDTVVIAMDEGGATGVARVRTIIAEDPGGVLIEVVQ